MAKLILCRLCLSQNVHMYNMEHTVLQEIYETLTNIRLASDVSSHMGMACYICYSLLQKSHHLQQQCNTANNELVQLSQECQVEITKRTPHRVDRDSYKWKHGLQQSEMVITDSTALSSEDSNIVNNIKKEETIEYEDSVPDGVEGMVTETSEQQRVNIRDLITFEDSNESEQPNTLSEDDEIQNVQEMGNEDNDGTPRPAKRLNLPETYEQQSEDTFDKSILQLDRSQESSMANSLYEKNKQNRVKPANHVINKTTVNDKIIDSMLQIVTEASVSKILSNEPNTGKESLKRKCYYCNNCKYRSVTKYALEKHVRSHDEPRRSQSNLKHQTEYHLEDHFHINSKGNLKTQTHSGDKPFACNICTYKSKQKSNLKTHLKTHSGDKPFACNICTYKCTRKSHLKRHLMIHAGDKPFACNICTYKCTQKSSLKEHFLIHTGDKPFACNICTYKCVKKSSLKEHFLTHTGDKPFACNICTYKCKRKCNLKTHLLTHVGDKPFACNICTYKCTQKGSLKTHLMTHSGDKPFACNICTYKCTQKSTLKTHLLTHSGDKPFACNICTYKCTQKTHLIRHLMIHTGDKPFACNICTYKCTHKSLLKRHLSTHPVTNHLHIQQV